MRTTKHQQRTSTTYACPIHKQRRCPHVRLGGPTHIVALSVALGKKSDGRATIHALPYKHEECQKFCEAMTAHLGREFIYYGEPQELVSQRAMHELMKPPKRPNVKTADETALLRAQNYECALCGDWLTRDSAHLDHIIARFLGVAMQYIIYRLSVSSATSGRAIRRP